MPQRADQVRVHLGLQIKELRAARALTQEEFAAKLGMLVQNYARIEQGRLNITLDTLVRIANGLGVGVGELFNKPTIRRAKPGRPRKAPKD